MEAMLNGATFEAAPKNPILLKQLLQTDCEKWWTEIGTSCAPPAYLQNVVLSAWNGRKGTAPTLRP